MIRLKLLVAGLAGALALAGGPAFAHDSGGQGMGYGPMMGGMGYGMMGPGGGYGMGPGMMGYGMGPGMMGYGMGPGMMGYGMGPGMMGGMMSPGMMGYGMGPGMMMGPGGVPALPKDLSVDEARHMLEHQLAWQGNSDVKLGKVEEQDADTIVAEIVGADGSVVQRLRIDRHTGIMQPAQ